MNEIPERYQGFVLDAAGHEDLAVSVEETGECVVTTTAHDMDETIAFERVCSIAHSHELFVVGGAADFVAGTVEITVADGSWTRGSGDGGDSA